MQLNTKLKHSIFLGHFFLQNIGKYILKVEKFESIQTGNNVD